jgi:hypothetical protein
MKNLILLRTNRFGGREADFARKLQVESGYKLAVLADEAKGPIDTGEFGKIPFDRARLRGMGLHCPDDAAWRCGDYGFYLARVAMPDIDRVWMIEPDVRAGVTSYADLFGSLAALDADFIAPGVARAERRHFWYPTMRWLTGNVYRCHFAFCMMSAEAADMCLSERRRQSYHPAARLLWPNDETFVATSLHLLSRIVRDVNESGRIWATEQSFGFRAVLRGEDFDRAAPSGLLHHPVLWGEDANRKIARLGRGIGAGEWLRLKALRALARIAGPSEATA